MPNRTCKIFEYRLADNLWPKSILNRDFALLKEISDDHENGDFPIFFFFYLIMKF